MQRALRACGGGLITERFRIGSSLRGIISNTGWLFSLRLLRILFSLFVTAWVARYLGTEDFGVYQYGIAFVFLFSPLAALGLQGIVVRDIVRGPEAKDEILGTTFVLRLVGGVAGVILVLLSVNAVRPDQQARVITGVISLNLLLQSFDTIDIWFQSQVQSKYCVIARGAALVFVSIIKIAAILIGLPVMAFAVISVVDAAAGGAGLVIAYRSRGLRLRRWRFSPARARELLAQSWSLILTGALAVIYLKIDQVMLGGMKDDSAVGIYSTAVRISEVWYFVPLAVTTSVFPALIRSRERGAAIYLGRLQQLYDGLGAIALAVAVALTFAASPLVVLLFGEAYAEAGPILAVHVWAGVFMFLKAALGQWLLNEGLLHFLFISNGLGAAANVALNLYLIPRYGGMGAAVATVISYACASHVACLFYRPARRQGWLMTKALFVPLRAAAALLRRAVRAL